MGNTLLVRYIRQVLEALREDARLARVPQQLLPPANTDEDEGNDEGSEDVNEFSGAATCGGGPAMPLGMSPNTFVEPKKNRTKRKK